MLRGAPSPCRPSAARSVAPTARSPTQAVRRTAPAAPRAAPSASASFALRHLATRAAPPPSGSRPQPPGRGAPKAAPQAPPQQQAPPGVYTGSDFIRKQEAKPAAAAANASSSLPAVVELSQLNVEEHVMRSPVPVIVDCYADWCDPCKQLTPLLEKAVRASGGAIRLGKLNVDMHQELAQMLKVEQLPTVYAFFQGRMIDGFVGMPVDGQLKTFIDKLLKLGGTNTAKPILAEAAAMLAEGDVAGARETYKAVLKQTALKSEAQALAGLARCAMAEKDTKAAAELVSAIRRSYPDALEDPEVRQAVSAVDLAADGGAAAGGVQELEAKVKAAPTDLDARLALATALFAAGSHSRAIDEALELLKRDKGWKEGAAKNLLMKIFDALGPSDPLVQKGRQRFTSILFL